MKHRVKHVEPLILASESPRRREILNSLGYTFEVYHRKKDIQTPEVENPGDFVVAIAERKAREPAALYTRGIILTADTVVSINEMVLGKPEDDADAFGMIKRLQGATHQVFTGICLTECQNRLSKSTFTTTDVTFGPMSNEEIEWYINTGEYHDKAGAYAIQGRASLFITGINGCFYNVVGLPVNAFYRLLDDMMYSTAGV